MATKKDLEQNIARKLSYLSEVDASFAVDCILDHIKGELTTGNRVEIRGFGSLSVRKRKHAGKDEEYNTIYYRMSKNVQEDLNK
ncbi:HU family DNA-binding protein [Candidatus Megaera venefica]|uniref:HU family DNA-binding protein n=1 Tax=Candidatus Megaera venefica TaxID=2055910 RepID=A0ABU5NBS2_9RICK|nr:HU family DNA-binding protein [Candidatus Megaera venefica]MBY0534192.1 HU family DNA-binding protein [Rickettsiaceae bacterium]MEA0970635.1 HU family DNA-binding protein [Candidatus Megaera venefica]